MTTETKDKKYKVFCFFFSTEFDRNTTSKIREDVFEEVTKGERERETKNSEIPFQHYVTGRGKGEK